MDNLTTHGLRRPSVVKDEVNETKSSSIQEGSVDRGSSCVQGKLPIILSHNSMILRHTENRVLCLCTHKLWLDVFDPLLGLLQQECTTPNGVLRTVSVVSPCSVLACVLQMVTNSAIPPTESYHWFCVAAAMWSVIKEVAHFHNQSVSVFKAFCFHPSYITEGSTWDVIAAATEVTLIQGASMEVGCVDFNADVLSHVRVTTSPELILSCELRWLLGNRLSRLWSEFFETEGATSASTNATSGVIDVGFAVKEEVEEEVLSVAQCIKTELESSVHSESGLEDRFSYVEIKDESLEEHKLNLVEILSCPVHHHGACESASTNRTFGIDREPCVVKRCKRNTYEDFDVFLQMCKDYNSIFKPAQDLPFSPFRKFHFGGPRSLIECPVCSKPYKGNASDMLDVCLHIKRRHRGAETFFLESVNNTYQDRVHYMKKKIRNHASKMYRRRLRCSMFQAD